MIGKSCQFCGKLMELSWNLCPFCGTPVEGVKRSEAE
jgi:RNA polymerase subunit RPABC4/transcription elongation factor Spt4